MNGVDIFYDVILPKHFAVFHSVGTVLGRAKYGDGFRYMQNCTVGEDMKDNWPVIGENCYMCAGSSIIGRSVIGDNVIVGAGCIIKNDIIPADSLVFGFSPNLIIKAK